ncbi:hypothetical protein MRX96_046526 [Rhipicephalus microplus]
MQISIPFARIAIRDGVRKTCPHLTCDKPPTSRKAGLRAFMCEWTRFNILTPAATAFSVARRRRMSLGPPKTRAFGSHETLARPGSHLDRRARPPTTRRNCPVFSIVFPAFSTVS